MPIREFLDEHRVPWRVWATTPGRLHPATMAEDYMRSLVDGWLTFERGDQGEKRRFYPIPSDWQQLPDTQLARLCGAAEPVRSDSGPHSGEGPAVTAERQVPVDRSAEPDGGAPAARTFLYPDGRLWTASELRAWVPTPDGGGRRTVLRFMAGARTLDLATWPANWAHYTDEELAELLRRAVPRRLGDTNDTPPRGRRYDDPTQ